MLFATVEYRFDTISSPIPFLPVKILQTRYSTLMLNYILKHETETRSSKMQRRSEGRPR
jgi:hypothetical protein